MRSVMLPASRFCQHCGNVLLLVAARRPVRYRRRIAVLQCACGARHALDRDGNTRRLYGP